METIRGIIEILRDAFIAAVIFLIGICGIAVFWYANRLLDQGAARVCRVKASSGPAQNIVVELVQPEPCDPVSLAREAQMAVNAALLVPPTEK